MKNVTLADFIMPGLDASIFYVKKEHFIKFIAGNVMPSIADLQTTHSRLGTTELTDLEKIYVLMQAGHWTDNGKANGFLESLGVAHTSMSIGDVVKLKDKYYVVSTIGFQEIS